MVTVNGIEVRNNEIEADICVSFSDLTQEAQLRLFCENKDTFLYEALTSEHADVHIMAINSVKECSAQAVNDTIAHILENPITIWETEWILKLINVPNFQLEESLRKKLIKLNYWPLKIWVAKDKFTSEQLLSRMFLIECVNFIKDNSSLVLHAVIQNKKFKITDPLRQKMKLIFTEEECRKIMMKVRQLQ